MKFHQLCLAWLKSASLVFIQVCAYHPTTKPEFLIKIIKKANPQARTGKQIKGERETFEGRRDLGFLPSRRAK